MVQLLFVDDDNLRLLGGMFLLQLARAPLRGVDRRVRFAQRFVVAHDPFGALERAPIVAAVEVRAERQRAGREHREHDLLRAHLIDS